MKEKLIIFGIGHLVKEIIDFVERYDLYEIVGFTVDSAYMKDKTEFRGLPIYPVETLEEYVDPESVKLFLAISWYHELCKVREEKYLLLKSKGFHFANLISPNAVVLTDTPGEGNWIMDMAYIGYGVKLGCDNVIAMGFSIAHYSVTGDHNYFGVRSCVLGAVKIGNRNFIGSSAVIFQGITVGNKCVIGAGSIVKKSIKDCSVTMVPKCKVVQMDEEAVEQMINIVV